MVSTDTVRFIFPSGVTLHVPGQVPLCHGTGHDCPAYQALATLAAQRHALHRAIHDHGDLQKEQPEQARRLGARIEAAHARHTTTLTDTLNAAHPCTCTPNPAPDSAS